MCLLLCFILTSVGSHILMNQLWPYIINEPIVWPYIMNIFSCYNLNHLFMLNYFIKYSEFWMCQHINELNCTEMPVLFHTLILYSIVYDCITIMLSN